MSLTSRYLIVIVGRRLVILYCTNINFLNTTKNDVEIENIEQELDIPLDIAVPNLPEAIKQQLVHDSSSLDADDFRIDKYNTLSQVWNICLNKRKVLY